MKRKQEARSLDKEPGVVRDLEGRESTSTALEPSQEIESEHLKAESTFSRIYQVVRQIPKGKVATYGQVAALAGNKRWARVVGYALHANPDPESIPCYRVVNRFGEVSSAFAFGGGNRQKELLEADHIPCPEGRVDLSLYQWEMVSGTELS